MLDTGALVNRIGLVGMLSKLQEQLSLSVPMIAASLDLRGRLANLEFV
jgi:hypothetical protein